MLMDHATFQIFLSIAMIAVVALAIGGVGLFRKGPGERQKAWLMLAAAIVLFANVLIWTV